MSGGRPYALVILKKPPVGIKEAKIEKALALMLEAGEKMLVDGIPGLEGRGRGGGW